MQTVETLNEGLKRAFRITIRQMLIHFLQHAGGNRAANVIALCQHLAAAACTHEFAADLFRAIRAAHTAARSCLRGGGAKWRDAQRSPTRQRQHS